MTALHQFGNEMLKLSKGLETVTTNTEMTRKSPTKSIMSTGNYPVSTSIDNISQYSTKEKNLFSSTVNALTFPEARFSNIKSSEFINPADCHETRKDSFTTFQGYPQICVNSKVAAVGANVPSTHLLYQSAEDQQQQSTL